jgi:hypothetical protein
LEIVAEERKDAMLNPMDFIPIVAVLSGTIMIVAIVAIGTWHKTRQKELEVHQEMRLKEMEHLQKMKELELEIEKTKARQGEVRAA